MPHMKTNKTAPAKKANKKSVIGLRRYDDAKVKAIAAFLKTGTNQAAKAKFGCSAHYAGKLRKKLKIAFPKAPSLL
jgi:hypothetical protein